MTTFAKTRCGHCRYFELDDGDVTGLCRRFAPRPGDTTITAHADPQWPHVHATRDWCGQFEPRKAEVAGACETRRSIARAQ